MNAYKELPYMNSIRYLPEEVWRAHRDVYNRIGREDWSKLIYETYFEKIGVAY